MVPRSAAAGAVNRVLIRQQEKKMRPVLCHCTSDGSSSRCGCQFKLSFCWVGSKDKNNVSIKLNGSFNFMHDNGCLPSREQLILSSRKAGSYSRAINEAHLKCILLLLSTNNKVSSSIMRDLLRPLFLPNHCLDAQLYSISV
jgi:hypothetical protein